MKRLELGNAADADLVEILRYGCERFGEKAGFGYAASFEAAFDLLCELLEIAPLLRLNRRRDVRSWLHRSHRIVYTFDETTLLIVRVLHAQMDIARLDPI